MNWKIGTGILAAAFQSLTLMGQGHEDRLARLDVQHYRFELTLSDQGNEIKGLASVSLKMKKGGQTIDLDLVGVNSDAQGMTVEGVTQDGKTLQFKHENDLLTVQLPAAAKANDIVRLSIQYRGEPVDGLIISKNKFGSRTFFGDNWPNRAHNWLPVVDHPSDKATVEFIVTAPEHYQVVANGLQLEESTTGDHSRITHWKSNIPLPTKIMVIGAADFAVRRSGEVEGKEVSAWVYPENKNEGFEDYGMAVPILKYYTQLIAPYPYEKLANVQSKTRYGGMENAGCIFYNEGSVDGKHTAEGLIAHEIVHQWFGNSASEATWFHIWLSEGFATYLTHLYYLDTYGSDALRDRMEADRKVVVNFAKMKLAPIVDPAVKDLNDLLNANSYQKGGWVLHMLREKVGDEMFRTGLKRYYDKFQLSNATTEDFRAVMEELAKYSLDGFFKQWIYRAGHPVLDVTWNYKKGKLKVIVNQTQAGDPFVFPLDIAYSLPNAKAPYVQTVNMEQKTQEFTFETSVEPSSVSLDPNVRLLFEGKVTQK